jgi:ribosomal protein S14
MPWNPIQLPAGTAAIVCTRGRNSKPCAYCGRPHTRLCDFFPLTGPKAGKTCDEPMCTSCATRPDATQDLDYCRAHARSLAARAGLGGQP